MGKDWSTDFPGIRDALLALPVEEVVIDGEAVTHGADGIKISTGCGRAPGERRAVLFAFDLLSLNGDDLRKLPLLDRKARLQRLLAAAGDRLRFVEHLEAEGRTVFAHASALGLEGIVSKRAGSPYTHGATRDWTKTKNAAYGRKIVRHR